MTGAVLINVVLSLTNLSEAQLSAALSSSQLDHPPITSVFRWKRHYACIANGSLAARARDASISTVTICGAAQTLLTPASP